jgi:hypothetical protein
LTGTQQHCQTGIVHPLSGKGGKKKLNINDIHSKPSETHNYTETAIASAYPCNNSETYKEIITMGRIYEKTVL